MNVNDFEAPECPSTWRDVLAQIFQRQAELMIEYKEIEQLPDAPLKIHLANSQRIFKDFAWRTTEELTEAFEAYIKHADLLVQTQHRNEELADALHFFVELLIFAGISVEQCLEVYPDYGPVTIKVDVSGSAWWSTVFEIGLAMNFLRNKPWKKSQVPTDELRFRQQLLSAFMRLISLWSYLGITMQELHGFYFRKSEVNKFRQRSRY